MNARSHFLDDHVDRLMRFSERLRALLVQRGHAIIPAQLAHDFTLRDGQQSVTPQTFSNWLNGVQLPRTNTLDALAQWLHVTPEYLVEGVPVLHFAPTKHTDLDTQQLVDHFQQLDAYGRRVALTLVAGLARLKGGAS